MSGIEGVLSCGYDACLGREFNRGWDRRLKGLLSIESRFLQDVTVNGMHAVSIWCIYMVWYIRLDIYVNCTISTII